MHIGKILIAGVFGGVLLLLVMLIYRGVAAAILFDIQGMRPMTDPVSMLFFLYPFVLAGAAAILYDILDTVLG